MVCYTRYIYLEPKWGPLFFLEVGCLFWRVVSPQKIEDKQVPGIYIYMITYVEYKHSNTDVKSQ